MRPTRVTDELPIEGHDEELDDSAFAAECVAFLTGRLVDSLQDAGADVPPWAWINEAAHADVTALQTRAASTEPTAPITGDAARTLLARAVVNATDADDVPRLQREVIVPIELAITGTVVTPRGIIERVATAIYALR